MALFDRPIGPETYAAIRFGAGFPLRGTPVTAEAMLDRLAGSDEMAARYPRLAFADAGTLVLDLQAARKAARMDMADNGDAVKAVRVKIRAAYVDGFVAELVRNGETDDPLRERLTRFWENHFAAAPQGGNMRAGAAGYVDEAIRPHITGTFGALLKSAVTHPYMLMYLDQTASVGPNSPFGQRRKRGLNENLAREVLELHTLGVGGPYSQADVTQFAELLTGLQFSVKNGFAFKPNLAEPGAETVLGVSYGGGKASLEDIHAALDDLAMHPATARHVSAKLAAHFVADEPDPDLVANMTAAWWASGGDLMKVYAAMLEHPASWRGFGAKVKSPMDFVTSAFRALEFGAADFALVKERQIRRRILRPMRLMGQDYQHPPGPDGFPDRAEAWAQPFGLAGRIAWAMGAPRALGRLAPDPRVFVKTALGDAASGRLVWAAEAAETRPEGVGIVLASAEFNRR